jgi:hypothetical protein
MLLGDCADGGSSVTRSTGTVPLTPQGTTSGAQASTVRGAPSGVRRTLSVPTCSGTGVGAFLGANNDGSVASGGYSVVVGGSTNEVCDAWSSVVGGGSNAVSASGEGEYGFIGGGGANVLTGTTDSYSAIVGGNGNAVTNRDAAIVGGQSNAVSAEYGFIGAGTNNTVSGEGGYVAAGGYNTASGIAAVVDGGYSQTASGNFATIPGGYKNSAAGIYSLAAGAYGSAAQNGAFVWSDGSNGSTVLTSSHAYQFLARASGGFTLYTNAGATVGAQLAAGSGTWASLSDRNAKTAIVPLDDDAILAKVDALPISRWSYKTEHGVRHVGPMAQDFYAAFGVGEDDKHITSIDEDGVALAAIKALHAENGALHAQEATSHAAIATLDAENARLRAGQRDLRSRLAAATTLQAARIAAMQSQIQRLTTQMTAMQAR